MQIDQLFENAIAQANIIGGVDTLTPFEWFNVDMTESQVLREVDGRLAMVPAMVKVKGQKQSERMLWKIGPIAPERSAKLEAAARQTELDRLAACYAANPEFELEVDPITFATGLAHAYRHHTGEVPTFLLDDDGEL